MADCSETVLGRRKALKMWHFEPLSNTFFFWKLVVFFRHLARDSRHVLLCFINIFQEGHIMKLEQVHMCIYLNTYNYIYNYMCLNIYIYIHIKQTHSSFLHQWCEGLRKYQRLYRDIFIYIIYIYMLKPKHQPKKKSVLEKNLESKNRLPWHFL